MRPAYTNGEQFWPAIIARGCARRAPRARPLSFQLKWERARGVRAPLAKIENLRFLQLKKQYAKNARRWLYLRKKLHLAAEDRISRPFVAREKRIF